MNPFLTFFQILISAGLVTAILLQARGGGLGAAFGGSTYVRTRRGAEKALFQATIILAVLFVATSLANFLLG